MRSLFFPIQVANPDEQSRSNSKSSYEKEFTCSAFLTWRSQYHKGNPFLAYTKFFAKKNCVAPMLKSSIENNWSNHLTINLLEKFLATFAQDFIFLDILLDTNYKKILSQKTISSFY